MTAKLAVFGNPVGHSRSPEIHEWFGQQTGIDLSYQKILIPEGQFAQTASAFLDAGGFGFNVTVPGKGDAYQFVDEVSAEAELGQAVNTVSRQGDKLRGDSTDGQGIVADMLNNLGWRLQSARILLVGAGGAVRAVVPAILREQPQMVHIVNRTAAKAHGIAQALNDERLVAVSADSLQEAYDIIINGTSAGLAGEVPFVPSAVIGPQSCTYDMVYGSTETAFSKWARDQGAASCSDGLGMLVEQAAAAFRIWFPDAGPFATTQLIQHMRTTLT